MIMLLNCKSVRKKDGLFVVCGSYLDGSGLLCFVCISLVSVSRQVYILIFLLLKLPAGFCSLFSDYLLVFRESPVNEVLCLAFDLMVATGLALGGTS